MTPSMPSVVPPPGGNSLNVSSHCLEKTYAGTKSHLFSAIQRRYIYDSCQLLSNGSAPKLMSLGHVAFVT